MSNHEHLQALADEFNARAKAEGRFLDKDFWEIPSQPGSILDVPETPESRERIEWLKQQIAELQRQRQDREGAAIKELTREAAQEVHSLPAEEPGLEDHPPAATRAG